MIDTHCHLSHTDFDADREAVIARCWAAGVTGILEVGYSVENSRRAVGIARAHPDRIRATVGIHPHESGRATAEDWRAIQELSREPEVVGIGETGLDFYRDWAPREDQEASFRRHVAFSVERGLPLIVHDRDAHDAVLAILRDEGKGRARGVFHCFSGDDEVARQAVDLGFYLGLGGSITYWNLRKKKGRLLQAIPLDRILLETDAPWLAPQAVKGQRNDPTRMVHVVETIAVARDMSQADVLRHTRSNTAALFPHAAPWPFAPA